MTAVDQAGQESEKSDLFACSDLTDGAGYPTVLIVNAFPKKNSDEEDEPHEFTASYFDALSTADSMVISSACNKAFIDEINDVTFLRNFSLVVWFTGDNTNHESTIEVKEMYNLAQYLEHGGNLFISGSKIGYDLDERKSNLPADTLFYYHYLKAKYFYVGDDQMKPATGLTNTTFANVVLHYGEVAEEKFPDDIDPNYGSEVLFNYNQMRKDSTTFRHAGIGFKGKFRDSDVESGLVYLSFPLETVSLLTERQTFFKSLFTYFDMTTDVETSKNEIPINFDISQNYPNPFNPSTVINYSIPFITAGFSQRTTLVVYDLLGRKIKTLVNKQQRTGNYQITFNATGLPSGVYFARLTIGDFNKTISMMLIK